MSHLNIEIKVRCSDLEKIREALRSRRADHKGQDHQVDTYFNVPSGKLKLREGKIENYLIYYERKKQKAPKQSNVILFKIKPNSPLKTILVKSLGILATVDKLREIYFIKNVKFHLDTVKDLGTFIEIEARDVKGTIGKKKLLEQCQLFLDLFKITSKDLVADSYSDLLLKRRILGLLISFSMILSI